jgi:hypothetical protein
VFKRVTANLLAIGMILGIFAAPALAVSTPETYSPYMGESDIYADANGNREFFCMASRWTLLYEGLFVQWFQCG